MKKYDVLKNEDGSFSIHNNDTKQIVGDIHNEEFANELDSCRNPSAFGTPIL
jgi:hypothetical protein